MTYASLQLKVYALIQDIPHGRLATYGQLAMMIGAPKQARLVGKAMGDAPANLPCHRVVGSGGRLVPGWNAQRNLLYKEGITFTPGGNARLSLHQWRPWEAPLLNP